MLLFPTTIIKAKFALLIRIVRQTVTHISILTLSTTMSMMVKTKRNIVF